MATLVELPKLSDTMEEGRIAEWLKKEGEAIEEGETLLEIETDKAVMEYPSPESGVVLKILVEAGTSIALNSPIAVIGAAGEKFDLEGLIGSQTSGATEVDSSGRDAASSEKVSRESAPEVALKAETAVGQPQKSENISDDSKRIKASPLAKKGCF